MTGGPIGISVQARQPDACYGMTCPLRGTCERYDPLIQWRLTTAAARGVRAGGPR